MNAGLPSDRAVDEVAWCEAAVSLDEAVDMPGPAPGPARCVVDAHGRCGLALELPDLYPDTDAEVRRGLARSLDLRRTGDEPPLGARTETAALDELFVRWQRRLPAGVQLARWGDFVSLPFLGRPLRLRWNDELLEIGRTPVRPGPARADLAAHAAAVNAQLRLAQWRVEAGACRLAARLPLADLDGRALCVAVTAAALALATAERVLPPAETLVRPDFAPLLALASFSRPVHPQKENTPS